MLPSAAGREKRSADNEALRLGTDRAGSGSTAHWVLHRPVQAPRARVLATTRVASFGVALLGLSYFAGDFEGSAVEGPLLDRVEPYSALVGILVVLEALVWQARGRE
jgi:hypothetical protein